MTILQSLVRFYERLEARGDAAPFGWADVRFGWEIALDAEGEPSMPQPLGDPTASRPGKLLRAPAPIGRTSGVASNFLWDKPAYVLGVVLVDGAPAQGKRTLKEHAAFRKLQAEALSDAEDPGLLALKRFLARWSPEEFTIRGWPIRMLEGDPYIAFTFEDFPIFLRLAAVDSVNRRLDPTGASGPCLITGGVEALATTHTQIKGVVGAQSSGAAIVSFNADAFISHGHSQGANAPVSQLAAFKYTTALNWLLSKDNTKPRRIRARLGHTPKPEGERVSHFRTADATIVYWAEWRENEEAAAAAEEIVEAALDDRMADAYDEDDDADAFLRQELDAALRDLAKGKSAGEKAAFDPDIRIHVLGLSPNNARIAVRFWVTSSVADFARHVIQHHDDLALTPSAFGRPPSVAVLLRETAVEGKFDNIPPQLAGQVMRSVLTGERYPRTLLSGVIGRIRADKRVNGARAALIKAVINRDLRLSGRGPAKEIPMALDPDSQSAAYRLGRLFALIEGAQKTALPGLNATVKDRFFGAACATPARVFPLLMKNAVNHLAGIRKQGKGGLVHWYEKEMGQVWAGLSEDLPRALPLEDQGRFVAGYYHQRFAPKAEAPAEAQAALHGEPDTIKGADE